MSLAAAYIALGSNLGDRLGQMRAALELLAADGLINVLSVSPVYQNRAIGMGDADDFYNAVAKVETALAPVDLLDRCLAVESQLGRVRSDSWAPRTIDLDLLLYPGHLVQTERLTLPHPRIAERDFVAVPLCDLDEGLSVFGKSIHEIVDSLKTVELTKLEERI